MGDRRGPDAGRRPEPGQLLLLLGVRLLPAPAGGHPVLLVRRPATAEAAPAPPVGAEPAGRARVEVEQVGADVVEQDPVVAGEQHDARQVAQERRQHVDRVVVEVVGRLVQEQASGSRRHQRRQGQPGPLSTGEGADAPCWVERPQAEPLGALLGPSVGVPRVVGDRAVERDGVRRLSRPVGVVAELGGESLDVSDHPAQRRQRTGQDVADRLVVAERRLLPEHRQVVRPVDRAGHHGPSRQRAGDGPQQGGLAGAVLADQADPSAGLGGQVDAVEHLPGAEPDVEVADTECGDRGRRHGGAFAGAERDSPGGAAGASRVSERST